MAFNSQITNIRLGDGIFLGTLNEFNSISQNTPGIAIPNKALVSNASCNIGGINELEVQKITTGELIVTGFTQNLNTNGLLIRSYSGENFTGRMIKKDIISTIDLLDYNPLGQIDYFSLEIIGYIKPLYTETYIFKITSDDKIRLWVNNKMLYNNWINNNLIDISSDTIELVANKYYPIYIQHSDSINTQTLKIKWQSQSQSLEIIPSECLAWDDRSPYISNNLFVGSQICIYSNGNITGNKNVCFDTCDMGSLTIKSSDGNIYIDSNSNLNILSHNGTTLGLKLNNILVNSTANELNYLSGITIGIASPIKALILDNNLDINGINTLNANSLVGTLITTSQPNITSIGTLDNLDISGTLTVGSFSVSELSATILTSSQPNITSLGILNSLNISGIISSTNITPSIDNMTGSFLLSGGISISNTTDATNITNGGTITTAGGASFAKSVYIGGNLDISGNLIVSGTTTTVNVETLTITDNIIALNSTPSSIGADTGVLNVRYQTENINGYGDVVNDVPKETHIITIANSTTITLPFSASNINDYYKGWWLKIISGNANNHTRKILSYNNITRIITLENAFTIIPNPGDNINLYNKVYSCMLWNENNKSFVIGYTPNNPASTTITSLDYADTYVSHAYLKSTQISESPTTGSLQTYGGIGIANSTNSVSNLNGGSFTSAGGGAFAKTLYVGENINVTNKIKIGNASYTNLPLEVGDISYDYTSNYGFLKTNGTIGTNTGTGVKQFSIRAKGRILCQEEIDVYSDRRMKKDIEFLNNDFCKKFILTNKPVSFKFKHNESKTHYGYIAQDILKTGYDNLVTVIPEEGLDEEIEICDDGRTFISPKDCKFIMCYDEIIPILAKNIEILYDENKQLKEELEKQKKIIEDILKKINTKY